MPRSRHAKGPRLWLQKGTARADGYVTRSVWCILDDGGFKRSTGCGADDRAGAESQLGQYLAEKAAKGALVRDASAHQTHIASVIALYARDRAMKTARPRETLARLDRLLRWWGGGLLSDVTGANCRAYATERGAEQAARRELEDLRAAIRHHRMEGFCRETVEVILPQKSLPRTRWLTRAEVARLLLTAWRHRVEQGSTVTMKRPWRHVARFIILALYTGTRAGAVCSASFRSTDGKGWVDLDRGVFYRRPVGQRDTKKRRPPVPLPGPLLAHLRRWARVQTHPVEFRGKSVKDVDRAFRAVAEAAGLPDVTPHILRHTAATWLMQDGVDKWEAAGFLGMTPETLDANYAHHHPDHLSGAVASMARRRKVVERITGNDREHARSDATKIVEITRKIN